MVNYYTHYRYCTPQLSLSAAAKWLIIAYLRLANLKGRTRDYAGQIRRHTDARSGSRTQVLYRKTGLRSVDRPGLQRPATLDRAAHRQLRNARRALYPRRPR